MSPSKRQPTKRALSSKPRTRNFPTAVILPGADVLYRTLIEQLPAIIYVAEYGGAGKWHYVSPKIKDLLGFTAQEWCANPGLWTGAIHPEDRERVLAGEDAAQKSGSGFCLEYRLQQREGSYRWFRDEAVSLPVEKGSAPLVQGILYDVHESKQKEQELRESQERLRSTLNNAPLVVFAINAKGVFLVSEGRGLTAMGLRPGQVVGQSVYDLYGDHPQILECFERALAGEEFSAVNKVLGPNLTYETVWMPLRNAQGEHLGVAGVATDITERMRAENALRESEERLRLALGAAQMGVWEWDAVTNRSTWDDNLCRIMGVEPGAFPGSTAELADLIHPDDRAKFVEAKQRCAQTGEFYFLEFRVIRHDGRMVWVADQGQAERDATGKIVKFRGVARDVSQLRDLLEQLHRAQKMEALGQLAVGIAHDFNNILTIIKGHVELLAARMQPDAPHHRDVKAISLATDRAAGITKQLLAFGRRQVLHLRELDLRAVVAEMANLLYPLIGPKIELQLALGGEKLWVKADDTQIEQVVLNLVINARDATSEGGTVVLSTDRYKADSSTRKLYPQMPEGSYVRISIRDNGSGMDAETMAHIFEPFFTTKAKGKGTGLGLASVYGIVKQSGGWIWVNSKPGAGTTFEVFFPEVAPPDHPAAGEKPAPEKAAPQNSFLP